MLLIEVVTTKARKRFKAAAGGTAEDCTHTHTHAVDTQECTTDLLLVQLDLFFHDSISTK